MEGNDPELLIQIDDSKLNLEVYQQIVSKVYAVIRYKVYQRIKTKQKKAKQGKNMSGNATANTSNSALNESDIDSVIVGEDDIQDLIKDLDIEAIRKEVFNLYDIKYGLDT